MNKNLYTIVAIVFVVSIGSLAVVGLSEKETLSTVSSDNFFVQGLRYVQDPRTHLCFALSRNMESSAILVPCENIPKELLLIADPTPK